MMIHGKCAFSPRQLSPAAAQHSQLFRAFERRCESFLVAKDWWVTMSRRTFGKLRRMLVRGETTATAELIRSTKEVERLNPTLRAVTHLAPNAQEAASFVDNTLGASASPVAGVPILIKDCINVEGSCSGGWGTRARVYTLRTGRHGDFQRLRRE